MHKEGVGDGVQQSKNNKGEYWHANHHHIEMIQLRLT